MDPTGFISTGIYMDQPHCMHVRITSNCIANLAFGLNNFYFSNVSFVWISDVLLYNTALLTMFCYFCMISERCQNMVKSLRKFIQRWNIKIQFSLGKGHVEGFAYTIKLPWSKLSEIHPNILASHKRATNSNPDETNVYIQSWLT